MDKMRLRFEKTGRAIYISHLDMMRTMQRVFARAGLELKYSEGFNPHHSPAALGGDGQPVRDNGLPPDLGYRS